MNKHLLGLWQDLIKSSDIRDGERLEDATADFFFPDKLYEMLHRSPDVNTNAKRFIRSSLNPDFQFEIRSSKQQFWVECKCRHNYSNVDIVYPFKKGQLASYKKYQNTFLFLAFNFNNSWSHYFIPLYRLKYDDIYLSYLNEFQIPDNECIPVHYVESMLR